MDRFRLVVSIAALVATITLGVGWNSGMVQAQSAECNCIDGWTKRPGLYGYDPDQERNRCIPDGCDVIAD